MSYCRWSSDNWMSDVYVYESCFDKFVIHVAGRRRAIPPIPDLFGCRLAIWMHRFSGASYNIGTKEMEYGSEWRRIALEAWVNFAHLWSVCLHNTSRNIIPLTNIGLDHDGQTYEVECPLDCADILLHLRDCGYRVPQYAIDNLRRDSLERAER